MSWVAVNKKGLEYVYMFKPWRNKHHGSWDGCGCIEIPQGSIKKLAGKALSWEDEPVELKEE